MKIFVVVAILAFVSTIQCDVAKRNTQNVISLVGTISNIINFRLEDDHKILLGDEVARWPYTKAMFNAQRIILDLANRTIKENPGSLPKACNWPQISAFGDTAWKSFNTYIVNPPTLMVDKQSRITETIKIQKSISILVTLCLKSLA